MKNYLSPPTLLLMGIGFVLLSVQSGFAAEPLQYNRDIRPILSDACFACHGPDSASRKADLRLDKRDAAIEQGALVPGKADESSLLSRILSEDPEEVMPPPASHKTITPEQRETLRQWINQGAEYQPHWSFIAPQPAPLPEVKNAAWVRNPIDRFVLNQLEANGLEPAPEASKEVLARRAALDVTGLPPSPVMLAEFLADNSPDAYEKYVDRLLQSERWGEHRGRFWLDYARYADTHGIHFDNYREMWAYRDWVIQAFNRNLPFDQFTIEQLAGDLLPNATMDQQIASGFNRCNITTNEGGVIAEEYAVLYTRDRTETTSAVWLGLTANCSVCHDHKFDPLSTKEFYSLSAFFNNTTQNPMDGNIKDTPPIINVPKIEDRARWDAITPEINAAQAALEERRKAARGEFDPWIASPVAAAEFAQLSQPTEGLAVHFPLDEGGGKTLHFARGPVIEHLVLPQDSAWQAGYVADQGWSNLAGISPEIADVGDFEKDQAFSVSMWVKLAAANQGGSVLARMNDGKEFQGWDVWLENGKIGSHLVHRWPEDALKVVTTDPIPAGRWNHVVLSYDGSSQGKGLSIFVNGSKVRTSIATDALKGSIRTEVPFKLGRRHSTAETVGLGLQDLRIYNKQLTDGEVQALNNNLRTKYLAKRGSSRTAEETNELFSWYVNGKDPKFAELTQQVNALITEKEAIKNRGTIAHIMQERKEPASAYILNRGEYDQRREQVFPDTPAVFPPFAEQYPKNRLGLAQWLVAKEHPLTARVSVNRFWQEVFGLGLLRTSGDFGIAGELPINQPLLDWLALHFQETGWDIKSFFKLMLTSAAYRQAAITTPDKLLKDRENRLLSRGPRFRMEGEMVRDYALAASGTLSGTIGGPSVRPYQPEGVWEAVAMIGSNTRDYRADKGDGLYRRSLYTFWKRSAPPASMEIFNAPSRETCTIRRERTNTPLQALVTLNDPQFIEAARNLAQGTIQSSSDVDARLNYISQRLLSRSLQPAELDILRNSVKELVAYYQAQPAHGKELIRVGESVADEKIDVAELAGWTMLINQMLNMDEVLCK